MQRGVRIKLVVMLAIVASLSFSAVAMALSTTYFIGSGSTYTHLQQGSGFYYSGFYAGTRSWYMDVTSTSAPHSVWAVQAYSGVYTQVAQRNGGTAYFILPPGQVYESQAACINDANHAVDAKCATTWEYRL